MCGGSGGKALFPEDDETVRKRSPGKGIPLSTWMIGADTYIYKIAANGTNPNPIILNEQLLWIYLNTDISTDCIDILTDVIYFR